jgi:hypothetical protein
MCYPYITLSFRFTYLPPDLLSYSHPGSLPLSRLPLYHVVLISDLWSSSGLFILSSSPFPRLCRLYWVRRLPFPPPCLTILLSDHPSPLPLHSAPPPPFFFLLFYPFIPFLYPPPLLTSPPQYAPLPLPSSPEGKTTAPPGGRLDRQSIN